MALNNMGLGFVFTAKDLASGVMRRVQTQFNATADVSTKSATMMRGAFAAVGPALASMGAGIGILVGGIAAANEFAAFEQKLQAVKAVTKATVPEFEKLKEAAIQAGIETQFSPDEAVEGLLSLATAGQTVEQATKTLIPVLDLAAGSLGQLGVGEAAEAVVGTLNAYGESADKAAGVTDKLLRITQLTNFQTRDFGIGLSKVAAAGATFNQNLDDMLISMGLLRNRNIDASSSATALRESMRRLGSDERAQKAIQQYEVDIFDASGSMRSLVDITMDFATATKGLTDEERNRAVVTAFGARGLLAFNAIQKAQFTQTKDGVSTTLQGAEAIAAMRAEMDKAKGTAQGFKEEMLKSFSGQVTLMKGSLQTLKVVAGEGFAVALKPIIAVVISGLNLLIKVIKNTPAPVKQLVAALTGFAGAFLSGGGAVVLLAVAIALLIPAIKIIGIALAAATIALLPLLTAVGAAILLFFAFKTAFEENVAGVAESGLSTWGKLKLTFDAIQQLFSQGGFSGAVRDEMQKAENEGVRNFAIGVFVWVGRIKNLFAGIATGFRDAIRGAEPIFNEFVIALNELGDAFEKVFGAKSDPSANQSKWEQFGQTGARVGQIIAQVALVIVKGLIFTLEVITSVMNKSDELKASLEGLTPSVDQLGDSFRSFGESLGLVDDNATSSGESVSKLSSLAANVFDTLIFGAKVMTANFSISVAAITIVVNVIKSLFFGLGAVIQGVVDVIAGIFTGDWPRVWQGAKTIVFGFVTAIFGVLGALVRGIAGAIDALGAIGGKDFGAVRAVDGIMKRIEIGTSRLTDTEIVGGKIQMTAGEPQAAEPEKFSKKLMASVEQAQVGLPAAAKAEDERANLDAMLAELSKLSAEMGALNKRPIQVSTTVNLDEQAIGTAVAKAQAGAEAGGFAPGEAYQP